MAWLQDAIILWEERTKRADMLDEETGLVNTTERAQLIIHHLWGISTQNRSLQGDMVWPEKIPGPAQQQVDKAE